MTKKIAANIAIEATLRPGSGPRVRWLSLDHSPCIADSRVASGHRFVELGVKE
jgi:hypothetical protein